MLKYIVRRLVLSIPVLLGVSILAFMIIAAAPGDFLDVYRINPSVSREQVTNLEKQFGLDKDPFTQYFIWLGNIVKGDWGYSFTYKVPVWNILLRRLEATLLLSVTTFIFTWGIGIPLGIYTALHQYTVADQALSVFGFIGISIPSFFFALLWLFMSANTGWFPVGGINANDFATFPFVLDRKLDIR
ncbi:MAG TPA: ABC transporter permease, partial [Tepiditoga sp.]|nr:ABC transporter permease [Tepiditoga sp.]